MHTTTLGTYMLYACVILKENIKYTTQQSGHTMRPMLRTSVQFEYVCSFKVIDAQLAVHNDLFN